MRLFHSAATFLCCRLLLILSVSPGLVCAAAETLAEPTGVAEAAAGTLDSLADAALVRTQWGGGAMVTEHSMQGSLFAVLPLWSTVGHQDRMAGSMLYAEPFFGLQDGGRSFGSLNLGFRHLFSRQSVAEIHQPTRAGFLTQGWYLGASLGFDWQQSALDQTYWQISPAVELGSRYLTWRSFWRMPLTDSRAISSNTTVRTRTKRLSTDESNSLNLTDYNSAAGIHDTSEVITSTRNTTRITRRYDTLTLHEEALAGWETELEVLIPGIDHLTDLRMMAGYYHYLDGDHAKGFDGWRLGAEWRPLSALVLSAHWFADERVQQSHWMAGLRMEIPLGVPRKSLFQPGGRHLVERLTEPSVSRPRVTTDTGLTLRQVTRTQDVVKTEVYRVDANVQNGIVWTEDGRYFRIAADGRLIPSTEPLIRVVPEPSRAGLLLLSCCGLLWRRQRASTTLPLKHDLFS